MQEVCWTPRRCTVFHIVVILSISVIMEIALGSTYSSFEEFETAFYKFMQDNDLNFRTYKSKSLRNSSMTYAPEIINRLMPLRYQRVLYACSTRGYNTPPGFVQYCKAGMEIRLERRIERLKVKRLCSEHDDSCCQVQYEYRQSIPPIPRGPGKVQVIEIETDQGPSNEDSGIKFEHSRKRHASDDSFHQSDATYKEINGIPTITEQTSSEGENGNISDVENDKTQSLVRRSARRPHPHSKVEQSNRYMKSKSTPDSSTKIPKVIKTISNSRENSTPLMQSSAIVKSFAKATPAAPDSADALFFSSLCAEVQTLSKHAKAILKVKLLQMVNEAVLEQEGPE